MNKIQCGCCGMRYSKKEFLELDLLKKGNRAGGLVYRNCSCRSTVAVPESEFQSGKLRRFEPPNYALVEKYTIKQRQRDKGMMAAVRYLAR